MIVMCGQTDSSVFKNKNILSTWECSHYTVNTQRTSHHFPLSQSRKQGNLILSSMSVSGFSVKNDTSVNCNEHLHSGSNCEKAESGCTHVAVSG